MIKKAKKKLLVIDDEESLVELICKVLERKGFTAIGATDGEEGLRIFKKEKPDLTLIDIYMPYSLLNGTDVLKKIKEANPKALCVMLTFMGGQTIVDECKELGATHFIRKPAEIKTLTKAIEDILRDSKEESGG